jgi:capsular exopolysaccharide synthesis family protein
MAQYSALKKEAQTTSNLYNALYQKIKEAGISAGSKSSGIRIMDAARVLDRPTRPNKLLNIGIGILAGLVGGIAIAFLKDNFDNRIHTPEDIMNLGTSSPISIIPLISSASANGNRLPMASRRFLNGEQAARDPEKFLLERPSSPEAEALRGLQTSLMLSRLGRSPQMVLVTSSLPGEGKTTLAINLALAMSQHGRTCIVEADLRKAGVSSTFGLRPVYGLSDVLTGIVPIEEALLSVPSIPELTILPSGPVSTRFELVGSEAMREAISYLRKSFTFVVIDSPPVLPYADARVLSTLVDGVVLVGRSGITTREAIQRSMTLLSEIHAAPILEIVLNAAEFVSPEYTYY